jgi:hypothetical protein
LLGAGFLAKSIVTCRWRLTPHQSGMSGCDAFHVRMNARNAKWHRRYRSCGAIAGRLLPFPSLLSRARSNCRL